MTQNYISAEVLVYTSPLKLSRKFSVVNIHEDHLECWDKCDCLYYYFNKYPYLEVRAVVNGVAAKTWLRDMTIPE